MPDHPITIGGVFAEEIRRRYALIAALREALSLLPEDVAAELAVTHPIIERMVLDAEKGERPRIGRFTI